MLWDNDNDNDTFGRFLPSTGIIGIFSFLHLRRSSTHTTEIAIYVSALWFRTLRLQKKNSKLKVVVVRFFNSFRFQSVSLCGYLLFKI